jgi:hypothetical protein
MLPSASTAPVFRSLRMKELAMTVNMWLALGQAPLSPIAPTADRYIGAILWGHLGRVGLDLVTARLAPHD